jgi:hypothetical protein
MCDLEGDTRFTVRACPRQHRKRDDRDFPKVDRIKAADARARIDAGLRCTKADRQIVDGSGAQQREQFAPACHIGDQTPARNSSQMPTGSDGSCWNSIGIRFPSMVSEKLVEARELAHEIVKSPARSDQFAQGKPGERARRKRP